MRRLVLVLLAACSGREPVEEPSRCEGETGAGESEAAPEDRRLIGVAADYPADAALVARWGELAGSQRARREVAWGVVRKMFEPVALSESLPLLEDARVPRFRTFYDREDALRLFRHLYADLSAEERAAQQRFDDAQLDDAFVWNVGFVDSLGSWPDERWDEHLQSFDAPMTLNRLGGIQRIAMSPAMLRHAIQSYPELVHCVENGSPAAEIDAEPQSRELVREPVELDGCADQELGRYYVPRGAEHQIALRPERSDLRLRVRSADEQALLCEALPCTLTGPTLYEVEVGSDEPYVGMLDIDETSVVAPVACLHGAMPPDSVSVAAEWRRLEPGIPLPTYDTSAGPLMDVLSQDVPTWGDGVEPVMPGAEEIYTQRTNAGTVFVLAGLHVRTLELPLGVSITLWWSDDPDGDFGADRPASIAELGPPWDHYKMCVTVEFTELDPDPRGGFDGSLGDAIEAVSAGVEQPTWCSNPYIDAAPGLAVGNCIGCHQHGMSGVIPAEIATDQDRFPSYGRLPMRNNFPSDGSWAFDAGDELAIGLREIIEYHRNDP